MQNNTHLAHNGPQEGCKFLLRFPNVEIHGAKQMSYDDHKKMVHGSSIDEQKIYWMRCLEEKQKNIERTKKYVGDQDVEWWDTFFNHQHTLLEYGQSKMLSHGILVCRQ